MPSPAGVNASLSKDLDHVGEAEICCIRRGRSQCRRGLTCTLPSRQAPNGSCKPMMAATERTTSLSRHSSFLSLSPSLPGAQKKSGQLTLLSPLPPIPTLPPLFFHILPLSALHSRTPGLTYAFELTYTLPLPPSFLQKMMMNP